jgi:hypothetical protein
MINLENPSGIRVIEQGTGNIENDVLEAEEGAIRPVTEALGLTVGTELFNVSGRLLAEGPTEYYLVPAISEFFRNNNLEGLALDGYRVLQMAGASNTERYSKWAEQEDLPFIILLDNDEKGEEIRDELLDDNPELEETIQLLDEREEDEEREVEFEDLFPPDIYFHAVDETYMGFDGYNSIGVERTDEGWDIEGHGYNGENLADIAKELVENQIDYGFSKSDVAQTLAQRLRNGVVEDGDLDRLQRLFQAIKYGQ